MSKKGMKQRKVISNECFIFVSYFMSAFNLIPLHNHSNVCYLYFLISSGQFSLHKTTQPLQSHQCGMQWPSTTLDIIISGIFSPLITVCVQILRACINMQFGGQKMEMAPRKHIYFSELHMRTHFIILDFSFEFSFHYAFYFNFMILQQRPWVKPVIFGKDKVTCLGVEYAQRQDDTYPFIKPRKGNKNSVMTRQINHTLTCQINQVAQQCTACPPLSLP